MIIYFIIAVVAGFSILALWLVFSDKYADRKKRKEELLSIADRLSVCLKKINHAHTLNSKIENCDKAIKLLGTAGAYPDCKKIISNFDVLDEKLHSLKKVLPVMEKVKKAHENRSEGKTIEEKKNLQDALNEIRQNDLSHEDFKMANAYDDETGEIIDPARIEEELNIIDPSM